MLQPGVLQGQVEAELGPGAAEAVAPPGGGQTTEASGHRRQQGQQLQGQVGQAEAACALAQGALETGLQGLLGEGLVPIRAG